MTKHALDTPQFYLTAPSPCPYLKGREARKVFTHLVGKHAPRINDMLSQGGFRRSQNIAYRPACEGCKACISVRVIVDGFRFGKSFKRILKKNSNLIAEQLPPSPSREQFSLFHRYLDGRHQTGGMAEMSALDYAMMVEDTHVETMLIEYRKRDSSSAITKHGKGALVATALTDVLTNGLSMVYSFFDPEQGNNSIGTFLILDHIRIARQMGLPYVYMGYWVKGSRNMEYKTRFLPQEHLRASGWQQFDPTRHQFNNQAD